MPHHPFHIEKSKWLKLNLIWIVIMAASSSAEGMWSKQSSRKFALPVPHHHFSAHKYLLKAELFLSDLPEGTILYLLLGKKILWLPQELSRMFAYLRLEMEHKHCLQMMKNSLRPRWIHIWSLLSQLEDSFWFFHLFKQYHNLGIRLEYFWWEMRW